MSEAELKAVTDSPGSGHLNEGEVATTFRALYEAWFDRVWRMMRRLGVRSADLEDATQDAFAIAAARWSSFGGGSAQAWLTAIAVRVASNHRRRPAYQREALDEAAGEALAHDGMSADEALVERDRQRLVQGALARLSEEQREVIVLHELEGLSIADVARIVEVPLNTLYSRLRLGRQAFEKQVRALRVPEDKP